MGERNAKTCYLPVMLFVPLALLSMATIVSAGTDNNQQPKQQQQKVRQQPPKQQQVKQQPRQQQQTHQVRQQPRPQQQQVRQQSRPQPQQQQQQQQVRQQPRQQQQLRQQPGQQQTQQEGQLRQKQERPNPPYNTGSPRTSPADGYSQHPAATGNKPDSSATMKFSRSGARNSGPTGNRPESSATMKFSANGTKNNHQGRPAYSLPSNLKTGRGNSSVLAKTDGDSILHQVNSSRTNMRGVNAKRIPPGQVSVHKDGGLNIKASGGRDFKVRPDGTIASYSDRGRTANFRNDGNLRSLRAGGMEINRGLHNERRIMTVRPDKSVLVSSGRNSGFLQRTVVHNNRSYVKRTYVENNRVYNRVYGEYRYGGIAMHYYVPGVYYAPAFYGWAYSPWGVPVRYSWGWQQDPWYGYYRGYFTPQAIYPDPAFWLADQLLAETLRAAYLARSEENATEQALYAEADTPITPEIKKKIAQEVKQQLALEREAAEHPEQASNYGKLSTAMRDPNHLFIVSGNLDVTAGDQICGLTPGDILQLNGPQQDADKTVEVRVVSSKRYDCPAHSVVTVALNDLQEMHNSMRERVYDGLGKLRQSSGTNGIPVPPKGAMSPPRSSEVAGLGSADENVLSMLQAQQSEADEAEEQVIQSAFTEELAMNYW